MTADISTIKRQISLGEFRQLGLEEARRRLVHVRETAESTAAGGFVRRIPPPLLTNLSFAELYAEAQAVASEAAVKFPSTASVTSRTVALAREILDADSAGQMLTSYRQLLELHEFAGDDHSRPDGFALVALSDRFLVTADANPADPAGIPPGILRGDHDDQAFVASVANMLAQVRRAGRPFTQDERSATLAAYRLLGRGVPIPSAYRGIGVYGFREHQTCLSVANPGDGHVEVTCASQRLLAGTIVHVEHIDRDGERDREKLEPYRLPAAINAARVRLHAGSTTPCTAFVGRPVFESGDFNRDLLKSVHMTASACTSMFMNGIADCKIGVERMTASQAIRFMRAVAGNVVRDPSRQYLSAAFNVNLPLLDDRGGAPVRVEGRYAIARLGIELALQGRFEKVTWDGASNVEPSEPIVQQLPYEQLVELVHIAHEHGLETYISAGLQPEHMRVCTHVGVDGVGIGTSLHDYNPTTGLRGQLKADRVAAVLEVRDAAAVEPLGRGAQLLARLDRLYYEGILPVALDPKRTQLFDAMRSRHEPEVAEIVEMVTPQLRVDAERDHPVMEQAARLLRAARQETVGASNRKEWDELVLTVSELVKTRDIAQLYDLLP